MFKISTLSRPPRCKRAARGSRSPLHRAAGAARGGPRMRSTATAGPCSTRTSRRRWRPSAICCSRCGTARLRRSRVGRRIRCCAISVRALGRATDESAVEFQAGGGRGGMGAALRVLDSRAARRAARRTPRSEPRYRVRHRREPAGPARRGDASRARATVRRVEHLQPRVRAVERQARVRAAGQSAADARRDRLARRSRRSAADRRGVRQGGRARDLLPATFGPTVPRLQLHGVRAWRCCSSSTRSCGRTACCSPSI